MGFAADDVATIVALIEHHLLLPQIATGRDIDDPEIVRQVGTAVGSVETLRLLAALTEADSQATGPSAWSAWKATQLGRLVEHTATALGGAPAAIPTHAFPTPELLALVSRGEDTIDGDAETLTVAVADRSGLFWRVAGALALHGLDVLVAEVWTSEDGIALQRFTIAVPPLAPVRWDRVTADVRRAVDGRLAIAARLRERNRSPFGRAALSARGEHAPVTRIAFDNDASVTATVIDVKAPDTAGLLYRVTRALAEVDVDIRSARVQTLGPQAIDAFYVCDRTGAKIVEAAHLAEIERAVLDATAT
jgi:[protein-PII] uridylyltransferase